MNARDVGASLVRRWYLSLLGLLATAVLALGAFQVIPPSYESTASLVLLPPKTSVPPGGNPYLELGSLGQAVDVLAVTLKDQATLDAVRKVSPTNEFTVEPDAATSGPIMVIAAKDSTPAAALATRDAILAQVPSRLTQLQRSLGIAPRAQITAMVLTQDQKPKMVSKTRLRAVVVVAGAGLVGTALLIALLDGYAQRRQKNRPGRRVIARRRRRADSTPQAVAPSVGESDHEWGWDLGVPARDASGRAPDPDSGRVPAGAPTHSNDEA